MKHWRTRLFVLIAAAFVAFAGGARAQSAARPSAEAGVALLGTRVLVARGLLRDPDAPRVEESMRVAYEKMRADEDDAASVVIFKPEGIGSRGIDASTSGVVAAVGVDASVRASPDLLVYRPRVNDRSSLAVVFLHGYGGRFALPCWQLARVVAKLGATTVCPSIGTDGDWWSAKGEALVRDTVAALRAAGHSRIVLAGLSNGGIGATRLAPKMRGTFVGLILISGADPSASAPGIPTLVLQGRRDAMVAPASSRAYAEKAHAEYVGLADGHFAMMLDGDVADAAIERFVRRF